MCQLFRLTIVGAMLALLSACANFGLGTETESPAKDYMTESVHAVNQRVFIGPQPSLADIESIKAHGIAQVISFRRPQEMLDLDFSEPEQLAAAGMSYINIPVGGDDYEYSSVQLDALSRALRDNNEKTLLHCGSGWRASVIMVGYLVREQGMPIDEAVAHAEGWWPLALEDVLGKKYKLVEVPVQ